MTELSRPLAASSEPVRRAKTAGVRKDIQGLRAIAVGLVVLNHLWPTRLPGGYIGVDVFFVISGFLISKHLLGEIERTGKIKLGAFYARRIKRLLPASLLVAVLALLAAWIFLPFSRWLNVLQETAASALYLENWFLAAKSVDYSAHNDAASTVQHYWSLSVEEQFYLVWPLLLLGLFILARRFRLRRHVVLRLGLAAVSLASLIFCVWFTVENKSQAYFVTPTRAWEFGAGALVALGGTEIFSWLTKKRQTWAPTVAQWLGYGLIVYSAFAFNEQTFFPGTAALLPVLGTMLVIASGPRSPAISVGSVLELRPFQFLGDVSYSLYLWHWPLIIILPAVLNHELNFFDKLLILALAILLSYLSKKFIEDPGRLKLFKGARPQRSFLAMGIAMAMVCALCLSMFFSFQRAQQAEADELQNLAGQPCTGAGSLDPRNNCGDPFGPPKVMNVGPDEAPWFNAPECKPDADPIQVDGIKLLNDCNFAAGAKPTATVWLVGDSHAEQWKAAVYELGRKYKWQVRESLLGGCPFVGLKRVAFMDTPNHNPTLQNRCIEWGKQVSERILKEKPGMVFASTFGAKETVDDGTGRPQGEQYATAVQKIFGAWGAAGAKVFVLRDTPLTLSHSSPDCVALNSAKPLECVNNRADALVPDPVADAAAAMKNPRVKVLDLSDKFCDAQKCYAVIGGLQVYYDKDHASRSYIKSMVPTLNERLRLAEQE